MHRTRVATRRYRSVLREIRGLLDPSAATVLDEGLRWYARLLGDVRDVQVLQDSFDDELDDLPDETGDRARPGLRADAYCTSRLETASRRLAEGLDKRRYAKLSDLLAQWRDGMPFVADLHPSSPEALTFLHRAELRFQRRLDAALAAGRPDLLMHEARKSSKRARYVAEMAAPSLGERADQTIRRMTAFQNELGTRQDRVVARDALTELAASPGAHGTGRPVGVRGCCATGSAGSEVLAGLDADVRLVGEQAVDAGPHEGRAARRSPGRTRWGRCPPAGRPAGTGSRPGTCTGGPRSPAAWASATSDVGRAQRPVGVAAGSPGSCPGRSPSTQALHA